MLTINDKDNFGTPAEPYSERQFLYAQNILDRINGTLTEVCNLGYLEYAEEASHYYANLAANIAGPVGVITCLKSITRAEVFADCFNKARRDMNAAAFQSSDPDKTHTVKSPDLMQKIDDNCDGPEETVMRKFPLVFIQKKFSSSWEWKMKTGYQTIVNPDGTITVETCGCVFKNHDISLPPGTKIVVYGAYAPNIFCTTLAEDNAELAYQNDLNSAEKKRAESQKRQITSENQAFNNLLLHGTIRWNAVQKKTPNKGNLKALTHILVHEAKSGRAKLICGGSLGLNGVTYVGPTHRVNCAACLAATKKNKYAVKVSK